MKQHGRKSAGALLAVTGRYPAVKPPATLSEPERAIWRATIDRLPLGWLAPEQAELAAQYCRHVADAARMREAARDPEVDAALSLKLLAFAQSESRMALAYARSLRLTPQSRIGARTAGRRDEGPRNAKPWSGAGFDKGDAQDVEPDA